MNWYYQTEDGTWWGPHSQNELVMLYDTNKIRGEDIIWQEGTDKHLYAYSLRPTWLDQHPFVLALLAIILVPLALLGFGGYYGCKALSKVEWSEWMPDVWPDGGGSSTSYNCRACGFPKDPSISKCPHCTSIST